MADQNNFGEIGEKLATEFLAGKGYRILENNWRTGHREIDIIACHGKYIVFVEVKTRSANFIESPLQAVNKKKQKLVIAAANSYIERKNIEMEARFDIISVISSGKTHKIEHVEDAFYPLL